MNNLEQVIQFQLTSGHTVKNVSDNYVPTVEERKLRLKLIFEELSELAEAYGMVRTFVDICEKHGSDYWEGSKGDDTLEFNKVEALDALTDLEVVTLGGYAISGFADIAVPAFKETMDSNMSKFCKTEDEALATVAGKDDWTYRLVNGVYAFFRKTDNKIMKGIGYFKPNYSKLLNSNG